MNLTELAEEVARVTGFDEHETQVICSTFIQVTAEALDAGEDVKLKNLGAFKWHEKPAQERYDMNSEEVVTLPPGRVLRFKPAVRLRGRK